MAQSEQLLGCHGNCATGAFVKCEAYNMPLKVLYGTVREKTEGIESSYIGLQ